MSELVQCYSECWMEWLESIACKRCQIVLMFIKFLYNNPWPTNSYGTRKMGYLFTFLKMLLLKKICLYKLVDFWCKNDGLLHYKNRQMFPTPCKCKKKSWEFYGWHLWVHDRTYGRGRETEKSLERCNLTIFFTIFEQIYQVLLKLFS